MLGYASYKDIKTREIHDIVWIIPAGLGLLIDTYEVYIRDLSIKVALYNIGFVVILSGILWYLSLFGEADLIAFVALVVIHPRTPLFEYIGYKPLLFSFTLIANTAIAGTLMAFYTLIANLTQSNNANLFERHEMTSTPKKIALLFTGRNIPIKSLRGPPFEYPLEVKGKLVLRPDIFDDDEAKKAIKYLRERGVKSIWVSSTLPYIVVLLVGYIISIVFGDVMFSIMSMLLL
jgi:hypothetical protein